MNPEVKISISALDKSQAAFASVSKSIDAVEKNTKSFTSRIEAMQPAFKKMAAAGTVAFAAISAGVYKTTQSAAIAEGSWNKFNTVFGEGADDMRAFIDNIRKEMPTATHEIARMGADLQDLLVPMGLARDQAQGLTQGFLDVANKVAAFNDVDPTEVLAAFKSGLSGSSEPLRRFGINALDSSIELEAMETGLLAVGQKLTDLDPITRSQIKAQALLTLSVKQSADAINGFEVNNDSLIRRQQDLQARIAELSVTLGNMFLPILDQIVKAVLPVVTRISEWTEANPELARNIIIATAAIAGVVTVLGTLGLILLPVIVGIKALAVAVMALFSPIGIAIAVVAALGYAGYQLWKNWDTVSTWIKGAIQSVSDAFWTAVNFIIGASAYLFDFLFPGWQGALSMILSLWDSTWTAAKSIFSDVWNAITSVFNSAADAITEIMDSLQKPIERVIRLAERAMELTGKVFSGAKTKVSSVVQTVIERGSEITGRATGGPVIGRTPYIVGEQGPELFVPNQSGGIVPNGKLSSAYGNGGITINISGTFMDDRAAAKRLSNEIMSVLKQQIRLS